MKSSQTLPVVILALAAGGAAFVAWRQHLELEELRGAAMAKDERAELQKRLWDLEKTNRELSDQLAALRAGKGAPGEFPPGDGGPPDRGPGRGARGPNPNNPRDVALRDLLARPEVQAMLAAQQKLQIEQRYAALFRLLNLSPDQAERLKTLLVERQNSAQEVLAVAREQGIDPRTDRAAFQKLLNDARDEVDHSIQGLLGDGGFTQLQTYERTLPQRAVVDQLQQRLSYTPSPLTTAQAEQLVGILAANAPPPAAGPNPNRANNAGGPGAGGVVIMRGGPDIGAMAGNLLGGGVGAVLEAGLSGPAAPITPAAINQAQGVLSEPQLTALQQIQRQQQQQQQVRQLFNETMATNPAGAKTGPPPPPGERRPGG